MKHPVTPFITNIPFVVNGNNLEATLITPLLDYVDNFANGVMKPGIKTVSAVINGIAPEFSVSQPDNTSLTITKEDARIIYTGDEMKATASSSTSTATITLRANILDITAAITDFATDPNAGDIRNAMVMFVDRDNSNAPISGWIPVTDLVDITVKKIGSVEFNWNVNIGTAAYKFYTVGIIVNNGGYYIRNSAEDNTVVTVYKPVGDFITGGGYIIPTESVGSKASDDGKKANFGFNVKFNKTGKNLQGNMNIIFRRTETDNIVHVYQIKANAMQSLGVNITNPNRKTAEYVSKTNLTDITNPLAPQSLGGNLYLYVKMIDNGEPGINDSISFVLVPGTSNPAVLSNIIWSSNWVGSMTKMMNLSGGNLVVHSGFSLAPSTGRASEPVQLPAPVIDDLKILVLGNPSESYFMLVPESNSDAPIEMKVVDLNGKVLDIRRKIIPGEFIKIGDNYTVGTYFAEFIQGNKRKVVKLVKQ